MILSTHDDTIQSCQYLTHKPQEISLSCLGYDQLSHRLIVVTDSKSARANLNTKVCSCCLISGSVCPSPCTSMSSTTTKISFFLLKLNFVIFGLKKENNQIINTRLSCQLKLSLTLFHNSGHYLNRQ